MRMLLGHDWHIAAICGNSLLARLPQLQFRNKLLVVSSWEWSVSCLLRSDLCFRRMTALPSLKTFGSLPQFTGLKKCLFSVLTHSGSCVIGLLQFHLISGGRLARKSSCSSVCTELLVSNLLQCISCYLYLVCTSLIWDKKLQLFMQDYHYLCEVTFNFLRLQDVTSRPLTTPLILRLHVGILYWTPSQSWELSRLVLWKARY